MEILPSQIIQPNDGRESEKVGTTARSGKCKHLKIGSKYTTREFSGGEITHN